MAVADDARPGHTPRVSRMRRLPFDSAVVRSSKLGWAALPGGTDSTSATVSPSGANATARLAPTMPPPAMAMSQGVTTCPASCGLHQGFDRFRGFLERAGQHLGSTGGHQ